MQKKIALGNKSVFDVQFNMKTGYYFVNSLKKIVIEKENMFSSKI
jgi:hypothetical protein